MLYLYKDIPLGDLDYVITQSDNVFSKNYEVFINHNFFREIRSTTYIQIPELKINIYECNHEIYDFSKSQYIFLYRYYCIETFLDSKVIFTYEDLSFILCIYNYLNYTDNNELQYRLDDFLCDVVTKK